MWRLIGPTILFILSAAIAQVVNINCNFLITNNLYTCQINGALVPDNENAFFSIGGQHMPGFNNELVQRIQIVYSNIPFVIPQLFTTFPNVIDATMATVGLTRIQPNGFFMARNLRMLSITSNQFPVDVHANAFSGPSNLLILDLFGNNIQTVNETAFTGLSSLLQLYMEHNSLQELHSDVFTPLTSLEFLLLSDNQLERLSGRLFANNRELTNLQIARNQINSIGRNVLDDLTRLAIFDLTFNRCVDASWIIGGATTIDVVREGLNACFNNFVDDDVRRIILEIRGPFVLRYENGTEIIRI